MNKQKLASLPVYFWLAVIANTIPVSLALVEGIKIMFFQSESGEAEGLTFLVGVPFYFGGAALLVFLVYLSKDKSDRAILTALVSISMGAVFSYLIMSGA